MPDVLSGNAVELRRIDDLQPSEWFREKCTAQES